MIQLFVDILKNNRVLLMLLIGGCSAGQAHAGCKLTSPDVSIPMPTSIGYPKGATAGSVIYEKSFTYTLQFNNPKAVTCEAIPYNYFTLECAGDNAKCGTAFGNSGPYRADVYYRILVDSVPGATLTQTPGYLYINFPDDVTQTQPVIMSMRLQLFLVGPNPPTPGPIIPTRSGTSTSYYWTDLKASNGGRVTFVGSTFLSNTTCTVTADNLVRLPTVTSSQLQTAGQTSGEKTFSITLSDCAQANASYPADRWRARTYFDGPNVDRTTGRLNVDPNGAKNVQVQLLNAGDRSVINAAYLSGYQNSAIGQISGGGVTLRYIARYFATGPATAGAVATRVNYTMEYP